MRTQRPEEPCVSRKYQLVMISRHVNTPFPISGIPLNMPQDEKLNFAEQSQEDVQMDRIKKGRDQLFR